MADSAVHDLIKYAIQEKPLDFEAALTDILAGRAHDAVDAMKSDLAAQLLDGPEEDEPEDEPEVEAGLDNEPPTEGSENNGEVA